MLVHEPLSLVIDPTCDARCSAFCIHLIFPRASLCVILLWLRIVYEAWCQMEWLSKIYLSLPRGDNSNRRDSRVTNFVLRFLVTIISLLVLLGMSPQARRPITSDSNQMLEKMYTVYPMVCAQNISQSPWKGELSNVLRATTTRNMWRQAQGYMSKLNVVCFP